MATKIYFWIIPIIIQKRIGDGRNIYFDLVINEDLNNHSLDEVEDFIQGEILYSVMDFAEIESNYNYGIVSWRQTKELPSIKFAKSPTEKSEERKENKKKKKIESLIKSDQPLMISKDDFEIKDNGLVDVNLPSLNFKDTIDFSKIWNSLESSLIGKIREGDSIVIKDDFGNEIIRVTGGGFLNVGLADIMVYDKKKKDNTNSIFGYQDGLKGGMFIREDGKLAIGDFNRTFYLEIYTNNLLKTALKLNKSISELAIDKFLNK